MHLRGDRTSPLCTLLIATVAAMAAAAAAGAREEPSSVVRGGIEGDAARGFRHRPRPGEPGVPWSRLEAVELDAEPVTGAVGRRHTLVLAGGGVLAGEPVGVDSGSVTFQGPGAEPMRFDRAGVAALVGRPAEVPIWEDRLESLDPERWEWEGDVEPGPSGLRVRGAGSGLRLRPFPPLESGVVRVVYRDDGRQHDRARWAVEARFERTGDRPARVRIEPGWGREVVAGGDRPLNVEGRDRASGRRELTLRFGEEGLRVELDGQVLARGERPGEALIGLALEVSADPADGAAAPAVEIESIALALRPSVSARGPSDPGLDAVGRASGDRLFGRVIAADARGVRLDFLAGSPEAEIPWPAVTRVDFRREPVAAAPLGGEWVRVEGHKGGTLGLLEGVLLEADAQRLRLEVPYAGPVDLPLAAVARVVRLGPTTRLVIDPHGHHLGDREVSDLDPPEAEGDALERRFALDRTPTGPTVLAADVLQLVGVEGTPVLSELVRRGELTTRLWINDAPLPALNEPLRERNDRWRRIRVPIPQGVLRAGENVLRIAQDGVADDPDRRDNFGMRNLAIEWPAEAP